MSKRRASLAERFAGAPVPTPAGEQAYMEELCQIREHEQLEGESKGSLVKRATRRLTKHRIGGEEEGRRLSSVKSFGLAKKFHKDPDLLDEQVEMC